MGKHSNSAPVYLKYGGACFVDPEKSTRWDTLFFLPLYLAGAYYQIFAGKDPDQLDVVVNYIDMNTKETVESGSYRAWADNAKAEEAEQAKKNE